jgi:hypothetical protein
MSSQEGSNPPWVVWAVVTIAVAAIGAYATIKSNESKSDKSNESKPASTVVLAPSASPTVVNTPTPKLETPEPRDLAKVYEGRLKNAVELAGNVDAQATRDLNEALLPRIFKGEALSLRIASIESLRNQGVFAIAIRHNISYGDIVVESDERHARVRAIPVWETTYFSIANKLCVGRLPASEAPQTIEFELTDGRWMVSSIVFDDNSVPQTLPCK